MYFALALLNIQKIMTYFPFNIDILGAFLEFTGY